MRQVTFGFGTVFAVRIWAVGDGFDGPYTSGATDIGAAIMYAVIFSVLQLAVRCPIRVRDDQRSVGWVRRRSPISRAAREGVTATNARSRTVVR